VELISSADWLTVYSENSFACPCLRILSLFESHVKVCTELTLLFRSQQPLVVLVRSRFQTWAWGRVSCLQAGRWAPRRRGCECVHAASSSVSIRPRAELPCGLLHVTISSQADHRGRGVWGMNRRRPLKHWDSRFESLSKHGCLSAFIMCCVALCAGSGLEKDWSPVQGVLPTV
jgi:hypothetical protein